MTLNTTKFNMLSLSLADPTTGKVSFCWLTAGSWEGKASLVTGGLGRVIEPDMHLASLVLVLQAVGHLAQQIWSKVGHFLFGTPWYLKLFVSEATKQTGQLNNTMPKFELLFASTTLGCGWPVILAISNPTMLDRLETCGR